MFYTQFIDELNEIWFLYASSGQTYLDKLLRYNLLYGSWSKRSFHHSLLAADNYVQNTTIILLSGSEKQIYSYDFSESKDANNNIDWTIETKDFSSPGRKLHLNFIDLSLIGHNIKVEMSTDFGDTYRQLGIINPGAVRCTHRFHVHETVSNFRVRMKGRSQGTKIAWMGYEYHIEPHEP
jgi:hypothetical protein